MRISFAGVYESCYDKCNDADSRLIRMVAEYRLMPFTSEQFYNMIRVCQVSMFCIKHHSQGQADLRDGVERG